MKKIMTCLTKAHIRLLNNDRGASMIEYALVVGAVAAASALVIGAAAAGGGTGLMGKISTFINTITFP